MTPFLRKVVELIQENPEGIRIVRRVSSEDVPQVPDEEGTSGEMMLVPEPGRAQFGVFPVEPIDEPNQFTYFIDGIQHSQLLYYQETQQYGILPVVYGYVSAMVLRRDGERHLHPDTHEVQEALYLPLKAVDKRIFTRHRIEVHDILEERELAKTPFATMLARAGATVARIRDQLERKMALDWISRQSPADKAWLVVDGSIADLMRQLNERKLVRVVGVSKSHRTSYLNINEMLKVFSMPARHRSSIFRLRRGYQTEEVHSWYLRLRWQEGASPTYGLVRVEIPVISEPSEAQEIADKVSSWLLQETRPLSLPDPRYDRLIYPFRMCEQHLRSRAPSEAVMRSALERAAV